MSATTTRRSPISSSDGGAASLGIGSGIARSGRAACEPRRLEERQVHRWRAFSQPLGDEAARRRGVLKAVAAEADREEESFGARRPADDRVIVGRQRAQAGPAAGDARFLD